MKKIRMLSLALAITMVVSVFASLSIKTSALKLATPHLYVGEEFVISQFEGDILSSEDGSGHINPSTIKLSANCKEYFELLEYSYDAEEERVKFKLKTLKPTDGKEVNLEILFSRHNGIEWQETGNSAEIYIIDSVTYLDLDNDTTNILDEKSLDQLYNLSVNETKSNVQKVKVSWTLETIEASVTTNKIWDTENLKWINDVNNASSATASKVNAKFEFENLSSVKIDAKVTFEVAKDFSKITPSFTDNDVSEDADGIITLNTKADGSTVDNKGTIKVAITPNADDFKKATEKVENGTYGTYTITISKNVVTSYKLEKFYNETSGDATIKGMNATALCQYMLENDMIADASAFDAVLVNCTHYSKTEKKNVTESRTLALLFDTTSQVWGQVEYADICGDNGYDDKSLMLYFNGTFTWDGTSFNKTIE